MDLMSLTAVELGKKIQAKEVTVEEAVKAATERRLAGVRLRRGGHRPLPHGAHVL